MRRLIQDEREWWQRLTLSGEKPQREPVQYSVLGFLFESFCIPSQESIWFPDHWTNFNLFSLIQAKVFFFFSFCRVKSSERQLLRPFLFLEFYFLSPSNYLTLPINISPQNVSFQIFVFLGKSCIFPEALGVLFLQANIAWLISIEGMITGGKEYSRYISFAIIQCGSNSDWPANP